ncbi:hypothetical protein L596_012253 [Steinernema carpocapsae]|uniref:SLC41A/MgtE integral membrane domain-containing protein n=1 Tax=Steinernema carpocapsae TaxID=34508 RepID=A0A4U5NWG2_STECR|nr:hypothetical protein L596_012253 [Steinernema carpocapsae]
MSASSTSSESGRKPTTTLPIDDEDSHEESGRSEAKAPEKTPSEAKEEKMSHIFLQSLPPLLIGGCGLIASGIFLSSSMKWSIMSHVCEVLILIPAFIGMKGNIEMSFSSRLSTMSHLGYIDENKAMWRIFLTNTALVQAQSILLSLFASVVAIAIHCFKNSFNIQRSILMTSTAVTAGSVSSLVMIVLMVLVIYACPKLGINPDNVAAPIAASIGDIVALASFIGIGTVLFNVCEGSDRLCPWSLFLLIALLLLTPVLIYLASREKKNRGVLKWGWWAPSVAVIISSFGGYALEFGMKNFDAMESFVPLIAGLGGNRCAVQASRISTSLHRSKIPIGVLPLGNLWAYLNPIRAFFSKDVDSRTAQILIVSSIPVQFFFVSMLVLVVQWAEIDAISWNFTFIGSYTLTTLVQVVILMYFTQFLVHALWRFRADPDHSSIPLITAIGDLLGIVLLLALFATLMQLNSESVWFKPDRQFSGDHCGRRTYAKEDQTR